MHKGQGKTPLLNARDHRALRRYCLRNHHAIVMDTWAREDFWKIIATQHSPPLHEGMQLEVVLCKEEGIYKFCAETAPSSLGPKSSEMDRKTVETWSDVSTFQIFLGGK